MWQSQHLHFGSNPPYTFIFPNSTNVPVRLPHIEPGNSSEILAQAISPDQRSSNVCLYFSGVRSEGSHPTSFPPLYTSIEHRHFVIIDVLSSHHNYHHHQQQHQRLSRQMRRPASSGRSHDVTRYGSGDANKTNKIASTHGFF